MRVRQLVSLLCLSNAFAFVTFCRRQRPSCIRAASSTTVDTADAATPNYGDAAGAIFVLRDGLLCRGDVDLIDEINWTVLPNERIGLVGVNGAGKSSLLTAIAGISPFEQGTVTVNKGTRVGYLVQKGVSGSQRTVVEEASSQMDAVNEAAFALDRLVQELNEDPKNVSILNKLNDAQAHFERVGGKEQSKRVAQVLSGLGFSQDDHNRLCSEFSGGWQMRISLARLLLSDSELLLLDEPTNHLDSISKKWLGRYLCGFEGTVIVVSHDEDLLNGMELTSIAEVRNGRLEVYKGCTYQQFLKERVQRAKRAVTLYEREQRERARLQRFVDRFGATATKASAAQSRVKQINRMDARSVPPPPESNSPTAKLKLAAPPACNREILQLKNADFGFSVSLNILHNVNLKINKGMRLAILGPNGAGKSTLLKALNESLKLTRGDRIVGDGVSIGTFTQDLAQDLPQESTALDLVLSASREHQSTITDQEARSVLGGLGLSGEKATRLIGMLSGGEKARVALAVFALVPRNLLLLDEPSNHLDSHTLTSLVEAIRRWKGAVIAVSHNRTFVDRIRPTHTCVVQGGTLYFHDRPPIDSDWSCTEERVLPARPAGTDRKPGKEDAELQRKRQKLKVNAPGRIKKIESLVAKYEAELAVIDEEMMKAGSDAVLAMELMEASLAKKENIEKLFEEWEELDNLLTEST